MRERERERERESEPLWNEQPAESSNAELCGQMRGDLR